MTQGYAIYLRTHIATGKQYGGSVRGTKPNWTPEKGCAKRWKAEGFFGNSKRSLDGTHHHISRKHSDLYLAELDHKYNTRNVTDGERTVLGIRRMEGKRLMLRPSRSGA